MDFGLHLYSVLSDAFEGKGPANEAIPPVDEFDFVGDAPFGT